MDEIYGVTSVRLLLATVFVGSLAYGAIITARYFFELRRRLYYLSKFPNMKKHWLLGNVYQFLKDFPGVNEEGIQMLASWSKEYPEGVAMMRAVHVCILHIYHPNTVKNILRSSEPKNRSFGGYDMIFPWLGDGLLLSEGHKWARNRRLLTPAFHFDILKPYMAVNNRCADVFLSKLEQYGKTGEYFELTNQVSLLTLDVILRCAFSYDIDPQRQGNSNPYVNAIQSLGEATVYRMLRPWFYPDFIFFVSPVGRQFKKDCRFVHRESERIIKQRRETLNKQGIETKKSRYLDFLDVLLTAKDDSGSGLSDREIRAEVDTFLFEGHDTTASGIFWTMYSLAKHPEHQERCQQEIDEVLAGKENKDIEWLLPRYISCHQLLGCCQDIFLVTNSWAAAKIYFLSQTPGLLPRDDLPKLNYLTMCIKEALRMHTPVPFIQRQTTKDLDIEGRKVPAGTMIDIHLYVLHHNPQIWEDPEEFRPERFSPGKLSEVDNYAFVPFSAGPRNCIGQHFAMHEMKTILARTFGRFTLTLDPDREVEHRIVIIMKTENGMYVRATPRESSGENTPSRAPSPALADQAERETLDDPSQIPSTLL